MIADFMTKPLQGKLCLLFKDVIISKRCVKDVVTLHTRSVLEQAKNAESRVNLGSIGKQTDINTERRRGRNLNFERCQKDFRMYNYFAVLGD